MIPSTAECITIVNSLSMSCSVMTYIMSFTGSLVNWCLFFLCLGDETCHSLTF